MSELDGSFRARIHDGSIGIWAPCCPKEILPTAHLTVLFVQLIRHPGRAAICATCSKFGKMLKQCLQHLLIRKSENAVVLLCSFPGTTAAYHALTESVDARLVMKAALYTATHPFVRLQKTGLSCILNSSLHSALSTCTL